MTRRSTQIAAAVVLAGILALLAVGLLRNRQPTLFVQHPVAVMGTDCTLQVVAPAGKASRARLALATAEAELRRVEARMSVHLDSTELARFNAAPAKFRVSLSGQTLDVLQAARRAHRDTGGAFDVTCRPLIELWKLAAREGRLPTPDEIAQARAQSAWDQITLEPNAALKSADTACVDLGGVAKGYAVDQAASAMIAAGIRGGVVEVGGDLRCFGTRPDGQPWRVAVRHPFGTTPGDRLATLALADRAVCTSGNYARYVEIQGRRYSHIIDPRPGPHMGIPAEAAPSVTVIAPACITADIWATALSVLGSDGLRLLPPDAHIEAMVVEGTADDFHIRMTDGFTKFLEDAPATTRPAAAASQPYTAATPHQAPPSEGR